MDATDNNSDIKLYKASGDLLPELQAKLPQLLYRTCRRHGDVPTSPQIRSWVFDSKTNEFISLLDRFQEWPQLLDPQLATFLKLLMDAFLRYITNCTQEYLHSTSVSHMVSPLPRAICRILYAFCKVRGWKVIIRFFENAPKYLDQILSCLSAWDARNSTSNVREKNPMVWEERYIMLLWLSHLMLTPFDLASVSSRQTPVTASGSGTSLTRLPGISSFLFMTVLRYLDEPGKESDAACILIVRLALRLDMQRAGYLEEVVRLATTDLKRLADDPFATMYVIFGRLSLLAGIMISGSDSDVSLYIGDLFALAINYATEVSAANMKIRASAPCRKCLIKLVRSSIVHAVSINARDPQLFPIEKLDSMLEDGIEYLLKALADKDGPVRLAAAKALSVVALKLEPSMATEVVDAVMDSLDEDLLPGNRGPLQSVAQRDFSSVNPLRWQGLMLTLGHLLFRRSPPPSQLPSIINHLLRGLAFEQPNNLSTSISIGVRDAACFGIWALARTYTTGELEAVETNDIDAVSAAICQKNRPGVLQVLAAELLTSACLDPSGNIRRGSSAALQELIGRHPDTVERGISLVQVVDYHAVGRHTHAVMEVAPDAAHLGSLYNEILSHELLGWRGIGSKNPDFRRHAAIAFRMLMRQRPQNEFKMRALLADCLIHLGRSNVGATAEARHGYLLGLASTIDDLGCARNELNGSSTLGSDNRSILLTCELSSSQRSTSLWQITDQLTGDLSTRSTPALDLAIEGTCLLISALCKTTLGDISILPTISTILGHCQVKSDRGDVVTLAAQATFDFFRVLDDRSRKELISTWLEDGPKKNSKGRLIVFGTIYQLVPGSAIEPAGDVRSMIRKYLVDIVKTSLPMESRVTAMQSITLIIPHISKSFLPYTEELQSADL